MHTKTKTNTEEVKTQLLQYNRTLEFMLWIYGSDIKAISFWCDKALQTPLLDSKKFDFQFQILAILFLPPRSPTKNTRQI